MNDLLEKKRDLATILEVSNPLRSKVFSELERKEGRLLSRAECARQWAVAVPKPEVAQKKEQKRPKMRDKLA
jgi:hypothetical protein